MLLSMNGSGSTACEGESILSCPLSSGAERLVFRAEWDGRLRLVRRAILAPLLPSPWSLVINVVRDPFAMVVSGMLYHKSGKECWGGARPCCLRTVFSHPLARGLDDLRARHAAVGLPRPAQKWYCDYLRPLNSSDALLAEMIRTRRSDLADMMSAWRVTQQHPRTMRSVCLEDFAQQRFRVSMASVLSFVGLPARPELLTRLETRLTDRKAYASHSTSNVKGARPKIHGAIARVHDARHFGGEFARDAGAVGCAKRTGTEDWLRASRRKANRPGKSKAHGIRAIGNDGRR